MMKYTDKEFFTKKAFFSTFKQLNFIYLHQLDTLYSLILMFHPNIKNIKNYK